MAAPYLNFIPAINAAGNEYALDSAKWAGFVETAARPYASRSIKPYIYSVARPNGEQAYYAMTSAQKRDFIRANQDVVCQKLKLDQIVYISGTALIQNAFNYGDKNRVCNALVNMARMSEAKDSSGCAAATRKISNDFRNLFKTHKQVLPNTSSQNARALAGTYLNRIGPPATTTLGKINIFINNLIKSPNFWKGVKILALAAAVTLIVLTGRLEMIVFLIASVIIQQAIVKSMNSG